MVSLTLQNSSNTIAASKRLLSLRLENNSKDLDDWHANVQEKKFG